MWDVEKHPVKLEPHKPKLSHKTQIRIGCLKD
jgi:hypothetical protein